MQDIDELIAKHFAAENSPDDDRALEGWLRASPENKHYFEQMQQVWQDVPEGLPVLPRAVDADAALRRIKQQIATGKGQSVPAKRIVMPLWPLLAAASVVGILLAAFLFFYASAGTDRQDIAATNQVLNDTLADGTHVALNRQSGLRAHFDQKERRVTLRGEAHFEVAPDAEKPFVIAVQNLEVKVIGTVFNVDNLSKAGEVVVSVEEGIVELKSAAQTERLTAGQQASFDIASGRITRASQAADPNIAAYRNLNFRFDNTPLSAVFPLLEKAYGTSITLNNKEMAYCPLHTNYPNLQLNQILDLLSKTYDFEVKATENGYVLEGGKCE